MYLDDVRDIYNGLVEMSLHWTSDNQRGGEGPASSSGGEAGSVRVKALNAVADSVEDLDEATRNELDHLSLICSSPKLRVDLWRSGAEIIAESNEQRVRSFAESLTVFTRARRNWLVIPLALPKRDLSALLLGVAYFVIVTALPVPAELKIYPNAYTFALAAALVVTLIMLFYQRYRRSVRVIAVWRKERRRRTSQTKRDLSITVISAALVGLLGLWAGLLVGK